jgi:hypothetical protein
MGLVMNLKTFCLWLLSAFLSLASAGAFLNEASAAKKSVPKECLLGSEERILNVDGTPVKDDDVYLVVDAKASCGKGTSFLDTHKARKNIVPITVGGTTHSFMALALYDKKSAPKCNQVKVRSACFDPPALRDGKTEIELYDKDTTSKQRVRFTFDKNGNPVEKHPEYALVRVNFIVGGNPVSMPTLIGEGLRVFRQNADSCKRTPRSDLCLSNQEAFAENVALERLRADRFTPIGKDDSKQDKERFKARFGGVSGMQAVIQEMFIGTELGRLSPYELSDATKDASGLTFGVRQLDIGANPHAKDIFSKDRRDYEQNAQWKGKEAHKKFVSDPKFLAPIRNYRVQQLFLVHDAMPTLQDMMRTATAMARMDEHHQEFLHDNAVDYGKLRAEKCFADSPFLALVAIDRRNQREVDYEKIKKKVATLCDSNTPLAAIEDEIADFYGKYRDRADKIRQLIQRKNLR